MPRQNSAFRKNVYAIVRRIPEGRVTTYGTIAHMMGAPHAAREVGAAMGSAPDEDALPCHRVVNRLGEMAPEYAFGGRDLQRDILEAEGVAFLPNGRIDMKRHLWPDA